MRPDQKVLGPNIWKLRYCTYRYGKLSNFKVDYFSMHTLFSSFFPVLEASLTLKLRFWNYHQSHHCSVSTSSNLCFSRFSSA